MKATKSFKQIEKFQLTPAQQQFVDQKLKDANEYLRTADLSLLFPKDAAPKQPSKS